MPVPDLPVLPNDESMLTMKFGREVANYFSGSPLNRLSFLRSNHPFLRAAFSHPAASFLLMNNLSPLCKDDSHLAFVSTQDVRPLTGADPFAKTEEELSAEFDSSKTQPLILFLGVDDKNRLPDNGSGAEPFKYKEYVGSPYFAVDITPRGTLTETANGIIDKLKEKNLTFDDHSPRKMSLTAPEAAIYGQARALLDWNTRNPFCAQCGQRTLSVQAGTKRICPPTDAGPDGKRVDRAPCATRGVVSNICFPRTDPTVIMAVVSVDQTKILLGRQKRWPKDWFSTLAGFLEPGESIEEAVKREVWEESGVSVGRVVVHSSQPWPFPNSLMIGAVAQATDDSIHLEHDPELESARWFPLEEVKEALRVGVSGLGEAAPEGYKEGALRLPPQTAIANQLMKAVVEGWGVPSKI